MSKNIAIIERRELKDHQGYMTLFHDHEAKESYWVKYDNQGYDAQGYDVLGFNRSGYNITGFNKANFDAQGFDVYGFDADGLNKFGFDRHGVQTFPHIAGDCSSSDDQA
jgi:hypothetical protein